MSKNLNKKDEEEELVLIRAQELCESQGGHPGLPFPNTVIVYIISCGRKATLNLVNYIIC